MSSSPSFISLSFCFVRLGSCRVVSNVLCRHYSIGKHQAPSSCSLAQRPMCFQMPLDGKSKHRFSVYKGAIPSPRLAKTRYKLVTAPTHTYTHSHINVYGVDWKQFGLCSFLLLMSGERWEVANVHTHTQAHSHWKPCCVAQPKASSTVKTTQHRLFNWFPTKKQVE